MSSIASSTKDRDSDKGFRGIGRLGGIASCDVLRFSCSAPGEDVESICEWDAKKTREIIADQTLNPPADELVDSATSYSSRPCARDEHFFRVEMIDVQGCDKQLLDVDEVRDYLLDVAPIPYDASFQFRDKIERYAAANGERIDAYKIYLNDEQLFKRYKITLYDRNDAPFDELRDVEFKDFYNARGEKVAWMWHGVSGFKAKIPSCNKERGIRLRKHNIQIGVPEILNSRGFYKESRSVEYFVGEVFVSHKSLVPNARRDYFTRNAACAEFEELLRPYFFNGLCSLYRAASDYKLAHKKQLDYEEARRKYSVKESGGFIDVKEREELKEELDKKKKSAEKAQKDIERLREKKTDSETSTVFAIIDKDFAEQKKIARKEARKLAKPASDAVRKGAFLADRLPMPENERRLVDKVYSIIRDVLSPDLADELVRKIQEKLATK